MQEDSWWTWARGDGTAYAPSAIDGLWRRVADRKWLDAQAEFGPLDDYETLRRARGVEAVSREDATGWKTLHYRLRAMAKLWQPSAGEPAVHALTDFNPIQHADATALRHTLAMSAVDGELAVRLDGWHLRVVPASLRGYLLMTCAADVAKRQRFRRCGNCDEWFPVMRTDNRFCSNNCRQAHHQAIREVA
jgi:hypothetical protein